LKRIFCGFFLGFLGLRNFSKTNQRMGTARKEGQDIMKSLSSTGPSSLSLSTAIPASDKSSSSGASEEMFAQNTSLFIKNLRPDMSSSEFKKTFLGFAPVKQKLTCSENTEKFGFLEFKTYREAIFCMSNMNLRLVLGQKIEICELEQSHQEFFKLEQVVDDMNDSAYVRYSSPPRKPGWNKPRSYYRGHSPKNSYQSDNFRGRSRSRSPRRASGSERGRSRRPLSPRNQRRQSSPRMQRSRSPISSPPRNRPPSRNQNPDFPRSQRSISPSSQRYPHKRQRTVTPDLEIIGSNDPRDGGLSSYLPDNRENNARRDSRGPNYTGGNSNGKRPINDDKLILHKNSKANEEIKELSEYLNSEQRHSRQDSDTITLPPSNPRPSGGYRPHSAQDVEDAFKPVISLHKEPIPVVKPSGLIHPSRAELIDKSFEPAFPKPSSITKKYQGNYYN
jgi:RNA recognition motif. (a.k.a. RRM, RBD, or RNP domain)